MSIPKNTVVHVKLDAQEHRELKACAEVDGIDATRYVEQLVRAHLRSRLHVAIELVTKARGLGFSGSDKK